MYTLISKSKYFHTLSLASIIEQMVQWVFAWSVADEADTSNAALCNPTILILVGGKNCAVFIGYGAGGLLLWVWLQIALDHDVAECMMLG